MTYQLLVTAPSPEAAQALVAEAATGKLWGQAFDAPSAVAEPGSTHVGVTVDIAERRALDRAHPGSQADPAGAWVTLVSGPDVIDRAGKQVDEPLVKAAKLRVAELAAKVGG